MFGQIGNWISARPATGLLLMITALLVFGSAFGRDKGSSATFSAWLRRIVEAAVRAILVVGLLWVFSTTLEKNNDAFRLTHETPSRKEWDKVGATWGGPYTQRELIVEHFIETQVQEEIRRKDPAARVLYRNVKKRQLVPQNSIVGFRGDIDLALSEPEKRRAGYPLYNTYTANARYKYDVINDSSETTEVEFRFPLGQSPSLLCENLSVTVDGKDISPQLRVISNTLTWKSTMTPQQRSEVAIAYTVKGMDRFDYQIPIQREIRNFALTMTVNSWAFYTMVEPEGGQMTPKVKWLNDPKGTVLSWELDRTVMTPKMGIAFVQPERPYAPFGKILQVSQTGPEALALAGAVLALTLLICKQPVYPVDLALFAGAYCAQFLSITGLSDYFGLWGAFIVGASMAATLTFLVFHSLSSTPLRVLIYVLAGFFIFVYPSSGLWVETQRNTFNSILQVGLIVYLFGLSLYSRLRAIISPSGSYTTQHNGGLDVK